MLSFAVIEVENVIEDDLLGLLPGFKMMLINAIDFQCFEETFDHGVVPTISFSRHTGNAIEFL